MNYELLSEDEQELTTYVATDVDTAFSLFWANKFSVKELLSELMSAASSIQNLADRVR